MLGCQRAITETASGAVCPVPSLYCEGPTLLTEAEVQRSYRSILKRMESEPEAIDRAEELLDELRPESPLRLRLLQEIEELRKRADSKH